MWYSLPHADLRLLNNGPNDMAQHVSTILTFILVVLGVLTTLYEPWATRHKTLIIASFILIGSIGVSASMKASWDSDSANTNLSAALERIFTMEQNNTKMQEDYSALQLAVAKKTDEEKAVLTRDRSLGALIMRGEEDLGSIKRNSGAGYDFFKARAKKWQADVLEFLAKHCTRKVVSNLSQQPTEGEGGPFSESANGIYRSEYSSVFEHLMPVVTFYKLRMEYLEKLKRDPTGCKL